MELKKDWRPYCGWRHLEDREDKEALLHNLVAWLKEQGLTAQQAMNLLSIAKDAIGDAHYEESLKIML